MLTNFTDFTNLSYEFHLKYLSLTILMILPTDFETQFRLYVPLENHYGFGKITAMFTIIMAFYFINSSKLYIVKMAIMEILEDNVTMSFYDKFCLLSVL